VTDDATGILQPWHWRSQPLSHRSGSDIFAALFRRYPIATLLESPGISGIEIPHSRYSICAGSPRSINGQPRQWTPPVGKILPCLRARLAEGQWGLVFEPLDNLDSQLNNQPPYDLPFLGGWLGWLGYDLAWEIEVLPQLNIDPLPFPVAFWYEPENFAVLDHHTQTLWLAASAPKTLDLLEAQLIGSKSAFTSSPNQCDPPTIKLSQAEFEAMVRSAKAHIQAGDIFQANVSVRFQSSGTLQPWQLYRTLQQINPSPFASYWQTPWGCVVSCSPERLVELRDRQAQTRPIAGTRPRGLTSEADAAFAQALASSPKERAEHTMLVDLERNDLGRVCEWGSVQVDEFFTIETYSHVMHLVSNVVGQLRSDADAVDLIRAVFPGGTITGCPKVRCMELIESLEPVRRSLFYGSCGFLDRRGFLDLNILIRTLLVTAPPGSDSEWHLPSPQPAQVWGQVGAGIVADSDPAQEWLESLQKAQAQWIALQKLSKPT
jgi:para-aminobenzoate synthetase component I